MPDDGKYDAGLKSIGAGDDYGGSKRKSRAAEGKGVGQIMGSELMKGVRVRVLRVRNSFQWSVVISLPSPDHRRNPWLNPNEI